VGEQDWQAHPEQVSRLAALLDIPVHFVTGNGHMLDHGYVGRLLDGWLCLAQGSAPGSDRASTGM
jgi:DNA mismatch repair protein MutH